LQPLSRFRAKLNAIKDQSNEPNCRSNLANFPKFFLVRHLPDAPPRMDVAKKQRRHINLEARVAKLQENIFTQQPGPHISGREC
jgi:hypothetical protein